MRNFVTTALEATAVAATGAILGLALGFLFGGLVGAFVGAIVAGLNGLVGGAHRIYDWRSAKGWLAFIADSTWGLVPTAFGLLLAGINVLAPSASHSRQMSRRQNRHIYDGGLALQRGMAFTLGNVISNANPTGHGFNHTFLSRHEELHIWQARIFGPFFPLLYGLWFAGGLVVGTLVWLRHQEESLHELVQTAAYYDNPFEYWAYRNDDYWPPAGAHPLLAWGAKKRSRAGE